MEQKIVFDPAAARDYLEEMNRLAGSVRIRKENSISAVRHVTHRYNSLRDTIRKREDQLRLELAQMQEHSSENVNTADLQRRVDRIQEVLYEVETSKYRLEKLWESRYPDIDRLQRQMEADYEEFSRKKRSADKEMERYDATLKEVRNLVNGGTSGSSGVGATPSALGWCPKTNWFSAVTVDPDGKKMVAMTIGGKRQSVSCDKAGIAKACRMAQRSGDQRMIRITSSMFEVESFRDSLSLGQGDPNVPQLGGYHGNVSKQDPEGFESHHIPSKASQNRHIDWLPALSITHDDHILTASHGHKQFGSYYSVFTFNPKLVKDKKTSSVKKKSYLKAKRQKTETYMNAVINHLRSGEIGYLHIMKNEILDLRETTGSKYDGAISAYLDAVLDMLATRGIPAAVPMKQ